MVTIDRMHKHGFKWILVGAALILAAWFGYLNWAYADIYDELNVQRDQAGLPLLTRDDEIDFRMLVRECRGGIRYSCALARQIQNPPQQQRAPQYSRQHVRPIPFDLNNPLGGIPPELLINGGGGSYGGSGGGDHSASRHAICMGDCVKKCSIMPSQESVNDCQAEVSACQANCP